MMTCELQRAITTELRLEASPGICHTRAAHIYPAAKAPGNANARVIKVRDAGVRATVTSPHARRASSARDGGGRRVPRAARRPLVANARFW
jgi:hypothetical protein